MFELEKAVTQWRNEVAADLVYSAADLDELEGHLRDEAARLTGGELSEEEAFLLARHRLGAGRSLGAEYGKVGVDRAWRRKLTWILGGYLAMVAVHAASMTFSMMAHRVFREITHWPYGILAPVYPHHFIPLNYALQALLMLAALWFVLSARAAPLRVRCRDLLKAIHRRPLPWRLGSLAALLAVTHEIWLQFLGWFVLSLGKITALWPPQTPVNAQLNSFATINFLWGFAALVAFVVLLLQGRGWRIWRADGEEKVRRV